MALLFEIMDASEEIPANRITFTVDGYDRTSPLEVMIFHLLNITMDLSIKYLNTDNISIFTP